VGYADYEQIWSTLKLSFDSPSKPESQTILHAIEELYFLKRFEEARSIARDVLKGTLNDEFRKNVEDYERKAEAKIRGMNGSEGQ
jgi:hypothetical protein